MLTETPGVAQDSFGDIHVRGEHRNLQYRLNGVVRPEGLFGFGQFFDTRALRSVSVLTGALPAQFGFRTNAVIDLKTRSGAGFAGNWDVFATGSLLRILRDGSGSGVGAPKYATRRGIFGGLSRAF